MNRETFHERMREFEGPIAILSRHYPIINAIINRYAHGAIITKEEALSQMVVGLSDYLEIYQKAELFQAKIAAVPSFEVMKWAGEQSPGKATIVAKDEHPNWPQKKE